MATAQKAVADTQGLVQDDAEQVRKDKALQIFYLVQEKMEGMYSRWQIFKEVEHIEDYAKPINLILERYKLSVAKMTKRPFGFTFILSGATYHVTISRTSYGYKRIK